MKIKSVMEHAQVIQTDLDKLRAARAKLVQEHAGALAALDFKITVEHSKMSVVINTTLQNLQ
jgi:hypothetical protein